jgi:hypothetical protein
MKFKLGLASVALALGSFCLSTKSASAQANQAVSNVTMVSASGQLRQEKDDGDSERDRHPMGWAGIGLKVGTAGISAGKLTVMGQEGRTQARLGLQVALPITLGGDGFGWNFEPYYMQSQIGHDAKSELGAVIGSEDVALHALGMYMGPTANFQATRSLYLGFGVGIKGAYLVNRSFDYAVDLYGRVPLHATYYVTRSVALTAEVGFGYGASAFADKPRMMIDSTTRSLKNVKDDPLFGLAYTWDATIGMRLP